MVLERKIILGEFEVVDIEYIKVMEAIQKDENRRFNEMINKLIETNKSITERLNQIESRLSRHINDVDYAHKV